MAAPVDCAEGVVGLRRQFWRRYKTGAINARCLPALALFFFARESAWLRGTANAIWSGTHSGFQLLAGAHIIRS